MPALTPAAASKRLLSTLIPYEPRDGDYIDLLMLKQTFPKLRWDLALLGTTASNNKAHIERRLPLLGRIRQMQKVVVLVSSLESWLAHYNTEHPQVTRLTIDALKKAQRAYEAKLRFIRLDVAYKQNTHAGRKPVLKGLK